MTTQTGFKAPGALAQPAAYRDAFTPVFSTSILAQNHHILQNQTVATRFNAYSEMRPPFSPVKSDQRSTLPLSKPPSKSNPTINDSTENMYNKGKELTKGRTRRFVLV